MRRIRRILILLLLLFSSLSSIADQRGDASDYEEDIELEEMSDEQRNRYDAKQRKNNKENATIFYWVVGVALVGYVIYARFNKK